MEELRAYHRIGILEVEDRDNEDEQSREIQRKADTRFVKLPAHDIGDNGRPVFLCLSTAMTSVETDCPSPHRNQEMAVNHLVKRSQKRRMSRCRRKDSKSDRLTGL